MEEREKLAVTKNQSQGSWQNVQSIKIRETMHLLIRRYFFYDNWCMYIMLLH